MVKPHMRSMRGPQVTPAEFHILLALAGEDRHGYAIMQQVAADSGGSVRLGPGTLYTALKRLLDDGFVREVDARAESATDDARRKYYRLTTGGRAAVRDEAQRLNDLVRLARLRQVIEAAAGPKGSRA